MKNAQVPKDAEVLYTGWGIIGYVTKDGIVHCDRSYIPHRWPCEWYEPLKELAKQSDFNMQANGAASLMVDFDGKPFEEVKKEIQRRGKINKKARLDRRENQETWKKLKEEFNGMVLGIDDVSIYPTGITVSVLINSLHTYDQQRAFIKAQKKQVLQYIQEEMPRTTRVRKKDRQKAFDLMVYCTPSEITLTRHNLLVIHYELKQKIQELLQ